jgi:hypothetical protein
MWFEESVLSNDRSVRNPYLLDQGGAGMVYFHQHPPLALAQEPSRELRPQTRDRSMCLS